MNRYGTISKKISVIGYLLVVLRLVQRRLPRIGKKPQTACGGLPIPPTRPFTDPESVIAPMARERVRGTLSVKPEHKAGRRPT
jgi:hypothetical protein